MVKIKCNPGCVLLGCTDCEKAREKCEEIFARNEEDIKHQCVAGTYKQIIEEYVHCQSRIYGEEKIIELLFAELRKRDMLSKEEEKPVAKSTEVTIGDWSC